MFLRESSALFFVIRWLYKTLDRWSLSLHPYALRKPHNIAPLTYCNLLHLDKLF
jgi:hypothetical protein